MFAVLLTLKLSKRVFIFCMKMIKLTNGKVIKLQLPLPSTTADSVVSELFTPITPTAVMNPTPLRGQVIKLRMPLSSTTPTPIPKTSAAVINPSTLRGNVMKEPLLGVSGLTQSFDGKNRSDQFPILTENVTNLQISATSKMLELPQRCPSPELTDNSSQNEDWTTEATRYLLDKYEDYLPQIGPMRKFKTKKRMWEAISEEIKNVLNINKSWIQCDSRFKTILKRKKVTKTNNSTSGSTHKPDEYVQELENIAAIDDSVSPEMLISASQCELQEKKVINKYKGQRDTKSEVLYKIHREKEESKKSRHNEKMAFT